MNRVLITTLAACVLMALAATGFHFKHRISYWFPLGESSSTESTSPNLPSITFAEDNSALVNEDGAVELLVDVVDNYPLALRDDLLVYPHILNSEHSHGHALYRVYVPLEEVDSYIQELRSSPAVEYVEFNHGVQLIPGSHFTVQESENPLRGAPDDPLYPFQWNLEQLDIEAAWRVTRGEGAIVAVIDTGVAYEDNPQLGFRRVRDLSGTAFVPGYDFVDDNNRPYDYHGHGTHVAGTIAQTTNNGYGVAGVAPEATIMPIRVLNRNGSGNTADIADAIRWAADNGANVINLSLGGGSYSDILKSAIDHAITMDVLVVAAAGNSSTSRPEYPASYPGVLSVSATRYDRELTYYSNYGPTVGIAAPGGDINVDQNRDGRPDGILQETIVLQDPLQHEFAAYQGTSMAAPHVAGVGALLHSHGVSGLAAREVLQASADADFKGYNRSYHGAGIVNAYAALEMVDRRPMSPVVELFFGFLILSSVICSLLLLANYFDDRFKY